MELGETIEVYNEKYICIEDRSTKKLKMFLLVTKDGKSLAYSEMRESCQK